MNKIAVVAALLVALTGCGPERPWHATDIAGAMPRLEFAMTRVWISGNSQKYSSPTNRNGATAGCCMKSTVRCTGRLSISGMRNFGMPARMAGPEVPSAIRKAPA